MLAATARREVLKAAQSLRGFRSSSVARAGGHGHGDDYLHGPHMYNITGMRARKLKFGLAVGGLVAVGGAVPWIACQWQFKKAQG